jgi:hypothetical protein
MQTERIAEVSRACIADKINDFINILDASPHHQVVNRHKHFLNLVALGMSVAALTLINLQICSHINTQITNRVEQQKSWPPVDISNLHEQHFQAVDQKLDVVSDKLATILCINKVHFSKMTHIMEQKFGTAVAISERLIHSLQQLPFLWGTSPWCIIGNCQIHQWNHK